MFLPGPFYCGRLSRTINVLALAWIGCITITFSLPTAFPVTASNMNYNALGEAIADIREEHDNLISGNPISGKASSPISDNPMSRQAENLPHNIS